MLGEVVDFPGAISYGCSLDEARRNLANALFDLAETALLMGESLPLPASPQAGVATEQFESIQLILKGCQ